MKKTLLLLCAFFFASALKSQLLDSLRVFMQHKYNIDARLESKLSLIDHQLSKVTGFRVGVAFKRKLRLGGGVDWLKTDYSKGINWLGHQPVTREFTNNENEVVDKYFKLMYLCFYADFVFHKTKHWQLGVPVQIGTGASWFDSRKGYYFGGEGPKYFVFLYEPGISVQYKVTKWFGGGVDFCYRFALQPKSASHVRLSSPSYAFKLVFLLDQLFFEILPESQISKDYGPAYW